MFVCMHISIYHRIDSGYHKSRCFRTISSIFVCVWPNPQKKTKQTQNYRYCVEDFTNKKKENEKNIARLVWPWIKHLTITTNCDMDRLPPDFTHRCQPTGPLHIVAPLFKQIIASLFLNIFLSFALGWRMPNRACGERPEDHPSSFVFFSSPK